MVKLICAVRQLRVLYGGCEGDGVPRREGLNDFVKSNQSASDRDHPPCIAASFRDFPCICRGVTVREVWWIVPVDWHILPEYAGVV
jgi:hypothetical protein